MAEDDNLVLHLLREIRSEIKEVRGDTLELRGRMSRLERHLEELHEGMVTALGMAGLAKVSVEHQGHGMDEIRDQIEALRRRVSDLEAQK